MRVFGSVAALVLMAFCLFPSHAFAQARCETGLGCACTAGVSCTCADQCSFECVSGACDFTSPGSARLECEPGGTCTFDLARAPSVVCFASTTCSGAVVGAADVTCRQGSTCSLTLGSGSTVACTPGSGDACQVNCTADCTVDCMAKGGTCAVTCAGGAAPTQCGTSSVCGGPCPRDAGVSPDADAGVDPLRREPWRLGIGCSAAPAPLLLGALATVCALLRRRQPRPA